MAKEQTDRRERRTLFILYVLAIYIFFQLGWWGYHLIQVNSEMLRYKSVISGEMDNAALQKKIWMVIGEGSVFILLISIGFWYVKRTISKELRLAHREKTFLLSVTHELKTPIAAIKLFLETMKTRKLTAAQSEEFIGNALVETKRLESLSENILLATKLDQHDEIILSETVDLSALVLHEIQRNKSLENKVINADIAPSISMKGDLQLLRAVVVNLIENAVKYSFSGSLIMVSLQQEDAMIRLTVKDHGQGIADDEKKLIFRKFYRTGNEETRSSKGTGLGLFIVQNIVQIHGGEIYVRDNEPHGSIFVVEFSN